MAHPPRLPVRLSWEQAVIYFVTICVADRQKVLANQQTLDALEAAAKKLEHWKLLAAVLMPDHLHTIVTPTEGSRRQTGQFLSGSKAVDTAGTKRYLALAAWLFRSPAPQ